jgi:Acetyl xylan esterase (AXE1)
MNQPKRHSRSVWAGVALSTFFAAALPGVAGSGELRAMDTMENNWGAHATELRERIAAILQFPDEKVDLAAQTHRTVPGDGYRIECVTFATEPGSRVTASLYLPADAKGPVPGIVAACGHGGSKSALAYQYAGQLYARLGFAYLVLDTIGEEERHVDGKMGTRAHDMYHFKTSEERRAFTRDKLKRLVIGKMVWDLLRGLDYLQTRPEVDPDRLGILGNSMGGTTSSCAAVVDQRIKAAVVSGWSMTTQGVLEGKDCSRMPYEAFSAVMSFSEMHALLAPHAATLFINGDSDSIIDVAEGGKGVVRRIRACIAGAEQILHDAGIEGTIECHFVAGGCHRPYFLTHPSVAWLQQHLMAPQERRPVSEAVVSFSEWVESQGQEIESLYNTEARVRGTRAVDIGAVYRDPKALACFPERDKPTPEYTFQGWVEACVGRH